MIAKAPVYKKRKKFSFKPYCMLMPMLLCALVFVYYPFGRTLLGAFSRINVLGEITGFVGLDNFKYLLSRREFMFALGNTLKLTAINVPVTVAITLVLAAFSAEKRPLAGTSQTLISLPMAMSMSASALVFKVLLHPTVGYINRVLGLQIGWYESADTALYAVLLLTVWMGIGFNYLLFLNAFRAVPQSIIDAAKMDGAGAFRRFFGIQLPLISHTTWYVICTNAILAVMTSGPIIIITQGGPRRSTTTLIYMMYSSGYASSNYSLAACVSLVAFLLTVLLAYLSLVADEKRGQSPV